MGFELTWGLNYRFELLLRGAKRLLGLAVFCKSGTTLQMLHVMFDSFDLTVPLYMVPQKVRQICRRVIAWANLVLTLFAQISMFPLLRPFNACSTP